MEDHGTGSRRHTRQCYKFIEMGFCGGAEQAERSTVRFSEVVRAVFQIGSSVVREKSPGMSAAYPGKRPRTPHIGMGKGRSAQREGVCRD